MAFVLHKPYSSASEDRLVELLFVRAGKPPAHALPDAAKAFTLMREAGRRDGVSLLIVSGHRSLEEQRLCFHEAQRRHGRNQAVSWVAPPGYSEHHTGYVFDIGDEKVPTADDEPEFEETPAFRWLVGSAASFGFELSFPRGNKGGVSYEPWHWRYVGTPVARDLFHPSGLRNWRGWLLALGRAVV
jgi:D-alanyl-D-alanine carboxypeptidase